MTSADVNKASPIIEMDWEDVHYEISRLRDVVKRESGGTTVYFGEHPDYGNIHIVVPLSTSGFLLPPIALRDF